MYKHFTIVLVLALYAACPGDVSGGKKLRTYGWDNDHGDQASDNTRKQVHVIYGSGNQAMNVALMQKLTALTEKLAELKSEVTISKAKFAVHSEKIAKLYKRKGPTGPRGQAGPSGPQGSKGSPGTGGGTTYIRYGRTKCPSTSTLVYSGIVAGTHYVYKGGGTNYLCLRKKFQWNKYTDAGESKTSYLWHTEYEGSITSKFFSTKHSKSFLDYNVPCALCHTPKRGASVMIAGGRTCNRGWTREYEGYLVSEHYNSVSNKEYVCLDTAPEVILGTHKNTGGARMYNVQADCVSSELPCKSGYREVTCVVCTK